MEKHFHEAYVGPFATFGMYILKLGPRCITEIFSRKYRHLFFFFFLD